MAFIENALLRKTLEPSGQESFSEVPQWKTSTQNFRNIALIKTDTQDNLSLSAEEIKLKKLNFFQGWKCSAGLDRIQINMDGSIYRALCQAGGPIGHISKDWKFPSEPVTCNTKQCFCSPEIVLEKHSP